MVGPHHQHDFIGRSLQEIVVRYCPDWRCVQDGERKFATERITDHFPSSRIEKLSAVARRLACRKNIEIRNLLDSNQRFLQPMSTEEHIYQPWRPGNAKLLRNRAA